MVELVDWEGLTPQNPGTPGWNTLAAKITGKTRRSATRVFVAVEEKPEVGRCHVLLAADLPEVGPEVLTPFSLTVRVTMPGVHTFVLVGASRSEEVGASTP
jgi:hypothetical protein